MLFLVLIIEIICTTCSLSAVTATSTETIHNHLRSENKYSARRQSIPSLASLFNVVTYWDKANSSSPCAHKGKRRDLECTRMVRFDRAAYEKSIEDMKKLILSRLNLDSEPSVRVSQTTMSFIDQLENRILNSRDDDDDDDESGSDEDDSSNEQQTSSMVKTKYDMKTPQNRLFNVMHEATRVDADCLRSDNDIEPSLCIYFEVPLKNFLNRDMTIRRTLSADLWLYMKRSTPVESTLELINSHHPSRISLLSSSSLARDDWTTIDLAPLFVFPTLTEPSRLKHSSLNFTLVVKCVSGCRSVRVATTPSSSSLANGGSSGSDDEDSNADEPTLEEQMFDIEIENSAGKKPLLSINIEEKEEIASIGETTTLGKSIGGGGSNKRAKRKINGHQDGNYGGNYKAKGLDKNKYSPKMCHNNYPDSERECCLVTYYVSFTSLKWASWIISPSGFVANYCSGKCYDKTSFEYASHNAEVKMEYNEKLLSKDKFDANEMLETCCHPISMESLVIKYMASNGSLVSTVVPNMIISGCGCS